MQYLARELCKGDIAVLDALSRRRVEGVAPAIATVGATVRHLPPDSPDQYPIEPAFATFKKLLRDPAERAAEGLRSLGGGAIDLFAGHEYPNYFRHRGYRDG